jgi:hypothetical protein
MTRASIVVSLFEEEPTRWGLRGDPYLWKEMKEHFRHAPMPDTADELVALIKATFESLTGHTISESEIFFIERFSHGGMSSGFVSPEFWMDKIIPMMRERFDTLGR